MFVARKKEKELRDLGQVKELLAGLPFHGDLNKVRPNGPAANF